MTRTTEKVHKIAEIIRTLFKETEKVYNTPDSDMICGGEWYNLAYKQDIAIAELSAKLRESEVYLVWSNEHNSWWRANSGGYTDYVKNAGEYTKEEALSICNGANYDWNTDRLKKIPDELPILKSIALELNYSTTPPKKDNDDGLDT